MANIIEYLKNIKTARKGAEVRDSIHDSIKAMNDEIVEDLGGMIEDGNQVIEDMQAEIQSVETMKENGDLVMKPEDLTQQQWADLKTNLTNYYKRYEHIYTTTVANETNIPIGITQYNSASILEVYIEGRMLTREEYTNGTYSIILNTPLSEIGTKVHFVVYRSVCATNEDFEKLKGDKGDSGAIVFNTVAEMKANTELVAGDTCQTLGYYEVNDGGAGLYKIVNDNTLVDDGGSVHSIENGLKAKLVIKDWSINVKQFGAYGDGVHDDTTAIQNSLNKSHNIYIPDGIYMINGYNQGWGHLTEGGVFPQSNSKIILSENAVLKAITNSNAFYNILNLNNVSNVSVCGGKIQGEKNSHTAQGGECGFGIRVSECSNIIIDNVEIFDCWGDGIITDSADELTGENINITISNCVIHDCRRQGISVVIGSDIVIDKCEIYNIKGTPPQSGIDIESNGQQDVYNIRITNCYIHDTVGNSIIFANDYTKNVTVSMCQLDSINIAGGEKYEITDCFVTRDVRVAGDDTFVSNCFISRVDIEGGNANFLNCRFERESNEQYSSLIVSGNDNYQAKAYDAVSFNYCKFIVKANYLIFYTSQLNFNPESILKFNNCDFDIIGENSYFLNNTSPTFILNNCKINLTKRIGNFFPMIIGSRTFKFIMKNTKIISPSKFDFLLTVSGTSTGKILIDIESCEINGYGNLLYVDNADLTGDLILYNNLINSNHISTIVNNSVIVKHEDNNIQYE